MHLVCRQSLVFAGEPVCVRVVPSYGIAVSHSRKGRVAHHGAGGLRAFD